MVGKNTGNQVGTYMGRVKKDLKEKNQDVNLTLNVKQRLLEQFDKERRPHLSGERHSKRRR